MTSIQNSVVAKATMLIRRPVQEVFDAFVDPNVLTRFWLARASGRLEKGKTVRWEFMVPGAVVDTYVKELDPNEQIAIQWSDGTSVRWTFEAIDEGTTVTVENWGFSGTPGEILATAVESTQGFTIVLCDLKTLLEHDASMNLVSDKAWLIQRTMQQPCSSE